MYLAPMFKIFSAGTIMEADMSLGLIGAHGLVTSYKSRLCSVSGPWITETELRVRYWI